MFMGWLSKTKLNEGTSEMTDITDSIPCHVNVHCPKCGDQTLDFKSTIQAELWAEAQLSQHKRCSLESWVALTTDEEWR